MYARMAMAFSHIKGAPLGSLVLLLLVTSYAHAQYSGGTGEPNDPYQIATAADLILLGETPEDYDKHFILTAGIDLSDWTFDKSVIAGGPFVSNRGTDRDSGPSGDIFTGNMDGQGFTVRKLKILAESFYTGLFGYIGKDGVVSNLILEDVSIDAHAENTYMLSGGVASQNAGAIINCSVTGTMYGVAPTGGLSAENTGLITDCGADVRIQGTGARVGGLVGRNHGVIVGCYAFGSIRAEAKVGGLVGENDGEISSSYSLCTTTAETTTAGGLVGLNEGSITDCQSHGSVQAVAMVGGLAGINESAITSSYSTTRILGEHWTGGLVGSDKGNATTSFWDTQTSDLSHSDGGIGLSTAEMQDPNTYLDAGWDFVGETENGPNDIWKIVAGQTYPLLAWQKYGGGTGEPNAPYLIYTAEHLNELGADTNDYDKHFKLMADIDLDPNLPGGRLYNDAVIAPGTIGYGRGGDGFYVGVPFTGAFCGNGHKIVNLVVDAGWSVGLFGVLGPEALVEQLGLEGVHVFAAGRVGALAAWNKGCIDHCYSTGFVGATHQTVGGLVGHNLGVVSSCYYSGTVRGKHWIGGLVGLNDGAVSMSYTKGFVEGINRKVGGMAGVNGGDISTSYSSATVKGSHTVGGLVGLQHGSISGCYSFGRVTGPGHVQFGGFVGGGWVDPVSNSFWDIKASGFLYSAGGVGLSTAEMQDPNTYLDAGWDFVGEAENGTEDIWWIDEGQDYPRLWWEQIVAE